MSLPRPSLHLAQEHLDGLLEQQDRFRTAGLDQQIEMISQILAEMKHTHTALASSGGVALMRKQIALFHTVSKIDQLQYVRDLHIFRERAKKSTGSTRLMSFFLPHLADYVRTTHTRGLYNRLRDGDWFTWWIPRSKHERYNADLTPQSYVNILNRMLQYQRIEPPQNIPSQLPPAGSQRPQAQHNSYSGYSGHSSGSCGGNCVGCRHMIDRSYYD